MNKNKYSYRYDEENKSLDLYINNEYQYTVIDCPKTAIFQELEGLKEYHEAE